MRKRITIIVLLLVLALLCLSGCSSKSKNSSLSILFIDVGQGDSALVECDGRYMLIDGGDTSAGGKVYEVLEERGLQHLDILAISHLHADHIGGLITALKYASSIDLVISNSSHSDTKVFEDLENQLKINEASITVPNEGEKFKLGSAVVEVVDTSSVQENDSLVLLITYGKTKYLFTGDIGESAQTRIAAKYNDDYKINVMKVPHHGGELTYRFVRTFMPDFAIFSYKEGNAYGHPFQETIDLFDSRTYKAKIYSTNKNGDILITSDGKKVTVETKR